MKPFILAAVAAGLPLCATAEPRHGTRKAYSIDRAAFDAQIWSGQDFIIVARTPDQAALGGFVPGIAMTVAQAFMADHAMAGCRIRQVALKFRNVSGVYQVDYRC